MIAAMDLGWMAACYWLVWLAPSRLTRTLAFLLMLWCAVEAMFYVQMEAAVARWLS